MTQVSKKLLDKDQPFYYIDKDQPFYYIDKDHPFYSKKADILWKKRIKKAEQEEIEVVRANRKRYKEGTHGNKEVSEETSRDVPLESSRS